MRTRTTVIAALLVSSSFLTLPMGFGADKPAPTKPSAKESAAPRGLTLRQIYTARIPEVRMDGVPLTDAIDFIRDITGANIHVNWTALEATGVGRDAVVTTRLRNVPVKKALSVILAQASGDATRLAYYSDDGIIEITTRDIADSLLVTRTYFVDDILVDVPDFKGPSFDLATSNSGGNAGGASGGSLLKDDDTGNKEKGKTKTERADNLVSLISQLVRPEIWESAGGPAKISYFRGYLIVSAPRSVHEQIGGPVE